MNKFNVGDKVIVTNNGGDYTTYAAMAKKMELKNWKRNEDVPLNSILEIDVTARHMHSNDVVYAVSDSDGNQYLVADDFMGLVSIGRNTKQSTAVETLEQIGYEWHGGEPWKPPLGKPMVEYEYIKVTDSIFDLRPDFEVGELYSKHKNKDKYYQVNNEMWLVSALSNNNLYRRTEKQVDWRDEVINLMRGMGVVIDGDKLNEQLSFELNNMQWNKCTEEEFLLICRTALRARGEL